MEKFLSLVAKDLFQTYKTNLSSLTVVFPSRRAGVFFTKYLSEVADEIIWSPKIITINELMQEISGYKIGDKIKLVLDLFNVYKKVTKSTESFDSFYYWGEMLINDFDDIDKYLVDPKELFQNITSEKEIEYSFDSLDDEQKKIVEQFLNNLNSSK